MTSSAYVKTLQILMLVQSAMNIKSVVSQWNEGKFFNSGILLGKSTVNTTYIAFMILKSPTGDPVV